METERQEAREPETSDAGSAGAEQGKGKGFDYGPIRLSDFGPEDLISLPTLARLFNRHPESIARAVRKGELPEPTRLCGVKVWTAGAITQHLEHRLALAAKDREKLAAKAEKLRP